MAGSVSEAFDLLMAAANDDFQQALGRLPLRVPAALLARLAQGLHAGVQDLAPQAGSQAPFDLEAWATSAATPADPPVAPEP